MMELYKYIKCIYSHGMTDKRYIHDSLGYNYRMTNIQAALLFSQLNDLTHILEQKNRVFDVYNKGFANNMSRGIISLLKTEDGTEHSKWMYVIKLKGLVNFKDIEEFMLEKNVQIRPFFYHFKNHIHLKDVHICEEEELNKNGIMLPSYPALENNEIRYIVSCIDEYISVNLKM